MTAANSYIAIDVETTGLAPKRDKILEIAALYVAEGQIQDRFVTLIQPCRPIAPEITRLTGITDDLVREAPEVEAVKMCIRDRPDTGRSPCPGGFRDSALSQRSPQKH